MELLFQLQEIHEVAAKLLVEIGARKVIAFYGEMGAGKTTLIHALCDQLGVVDTVSSPTFSIINQYQTRTGETLCHMDLYRLKDEEEVINAGVEDQLYSGNLCFVEWPEKAGSLLPDDTVSIRIVSAGAEARKLEIKL